MASKRELIQPHKGDKRFVRRDSEGHFAESDEVGRSQSQDRRRKAKTVAKPGQGDRGDRKPPKAVAPRRRRTRVRYPLLRSPIVVLSGAMVHAITTRRSSTAFKAAQLAEQVIVIEQLGRVKAS